MPEFQKSIPLALKDGNGNLQAITLSDETHYAFAGGERLVSDNTVKTDRYSGNLTSSSTNATSIGAFTDTFYNEAICTHPGSALSTGSTSTTLYQMDDSAAIPYNNIPLAVDSDGAIHEMDTDSWLRWGERLGEELLSNEYPGLSFRVAASAPSADWQQWDSDVFSDTLTNGTANTYSIWRRKTATAPSAPTYNLVDLKGSFGARDFSTNVDLQEMTDAQTQISSLRAIEYARKNAGIGDYLFLPAGQTPSSNGETGTWVARGTAVDTRNTTEDQQYAGQYTGVAQYSNQYEGVRSFTGQYTSADTNFASAEAQFAGNVTSNFNITSQFTSAEAQFAGNVTSDRKSVV